ncbi:MAG: TlpA family protein disulfide reductase [Alphaproteobacteria bacterium]|nr:TlpA family protein disulfide reductase [Alphaproteobacteria bacterium]
MRPKIIAFAVLLLLAGAAASYDWWHRPALTAIQAPAQMVSKEGPLAADRVFTDTKGTVVSLKDLRGRVVLLHFWASWCATCLAEFPDLLRAVAAQGGDVVLLAVSIDDDPSAMNRAIDRLVPPESEAPHTVWIWDEGKDISLRGFNVLRTPETVVIDGAGRLRDKIAGPGDWATMDFTALSG